jgi:hypothetical protein
MRSITARTILNSQSSVAARSLTLELEAFDCPGPATTSLITSPVSMTSRRRLPPIEPHACDGQRRRYVRQGARVVVRNWRNGKSAPRERGLVGSVPARRAGRTSLRSSRRRRKESGTPWLAGVLFAQVMNGTGTTPAVHLTGRSAKLPGGLVCCAGPKGITGRGRRRRTLTDAAWPTPQAPLPACAPG